MVAQSNTISYRYLCRAQKTAHRDAGAHVQRKDAMISLTDILIRYKNMKRIYGYKMDSILEQYRNG